MSVDVNGLYRFEVFLSHFLCFCCFDCTLLCNFGFFRWVSVLTLLGVGRICDCDLYWVFSIGVGRFRILGGGARFRILGGGGAANSQQAHDVVMTSMRRNDVASTSFRRHVPNRFLINQCQIIAFLILKASTKFRIERNSFASTFKSN